MEIKLDKKIGRGAIITLLSALAVYLILREGDRLSAIWNTFYGLISPFLLGALLAFALNVPMRFFERKLKFIKSPKYRRVVSIIITLLCVLAVVVIVSIILIPQIKESIQLFALQLPAFLQSINDKLLEWMEKVPALESVLGFVNLENGIDWTALLNIILDAFETSTSGLVGDVVVFLSDMVSAIYNGVFSVIFAFYCLTQKETLARQGRKILYSVVKEKYADEIIRVLRMSNSVFSNFITGQCLDAVILGLMCALVMACLGLPYITLICVIIIVTALVPVVGALVGCVIGAFLIFVSSPAKALTFVIMFIIVQQIDNNIVYPRVVGSSIGLPGMWVLVAVSVGGGLMGAIGMLMMVPVASVLYTLIRQFAARQVKRRNIPEEKLVAHDPNLQPHFVFNRSAKKTKKEAQPVPEEQSNEEVKAEEA